MEANKRFMTKHSVLIQHCVSIFIAVSFALASFSAAAKSDKKKEQRYPSGCYQEGFSFHHGVLHLHPGENGAKQSMFFIHNLSAKTPIQLFQMKSGDDPYVINLNNTIKANVWGVFATTQNLDKFICTIPEYKNKYGKIVDCKQYLDVCEYTNALFAITNRGDYWIVRGLSMRGAQRSTTYQGSLLRGKSKDEVIIIEEDKNDPENEAIKQEEIVQ